MKYALNDTEDITIDNSSSEENIKGYVLSFEKNEINAKLKSEGIEPHKVSQAINYLNNNNEKSCYTITVFYTHLKRNITFRNIPTEYCKSEYKNNEVKFIIPDIVIEYCENILKKLMKEGYDFDKDEEIDFQKYLV